MNLATPQVIGAPEQTIILSPSYWVPLGVFCVSLPLFWAQLWLGGLVLALSLFLGFQALTVRLHFTPEALELYRGSQQLCCFPYQDWLNWQIFWLPVPILFYFREINSIHFTPMLFNVQQLQACLEARCPQISE